MDKKKIKILAQKSYKGQLLNENLVKKIAVSLNRQDLKKYIFALKNIESSKSLIVVAQTPGNYKKKIQEIFPNKKIVFKEDPSVLLGVKLIDSDMVYDFTLQNTLEKILDFVDKNYD